MISVSDEFLAAIRGPHVQATRVVITAPDGRFLTTDDESLTIEDGSVTIDRQADFRRQLSLSLSDPRLYPDTTSDIVNVYGAECQVWRGVRFANNRVELASLGIFRIQDATRDTPGGGVVITGWDRSVQVADQRFLAPRKFASQLATDLIQLLISEVYPSAVFDVRTADTTTIPKHVVDRDRWPEVQRVSQVIGCETYCDAQGVWVIADVPDPTTATPVWAVDSGEGGVLVSVSDTVTRDNALNVVVTLGESASGTASVHGQARDDDPLSPTYSLGPFGLVARFYSSPHIRTTAQANRVAAALLADHTGITRTVDFNAIPNPALEAGDAVQINRPDGTSELHIVDAFVVPLSPSGDMQGSTRAVDWTAAQ